jgi:hypothetical protein
MVQDVDTDKPQEEVAKHGSGLRFIIGERYRLPILYPKTGLVNRHGGGLAAAVEIREAGADRAILFPIAPDGVRTQRAIPGQR